MLYAFYPTVALYVRFSADLAENAKNKVNDDVVCLVTEEAAATAVVVIVVLSVSENQFNKIISFNRKISRFSADFVAEPILCIFFLFPSRNSRTSIV